MNYYKMNRKKDTYSRILECAESLFAQKGYEGTSTRQIASEARIAVHTLHYHFGGKRQLYLAVLEKAIIPVRDIVNKYAAELLNQEVKDGRALKETIIKIIDELFAMLFSNPNYSLLFYRTWVEQDEDLMTFGWEYALSSMQEWARHIEDTADKKLTRDIDLSLFFMSVAWMYWGLFIQPQFLGDLLDIDHKSPEYLSKVKAHAKEMTLRMLGQRGFNG